MLVIPAIDLRAGRCVRLLQGRRDEQTVYSDDPVEMALRWENEGAQYLHIVDLDGAFEGISRNLGAVGEILERVRVPAELGGGIRTVGAIARLLSLGLDRVILGTAAVLDSGLVKRAVGRFGPRRVVVGIDARAGRVAIKGWEQEADLLAMELAAKMKALGVERIVYTDITKDGTLLGPNIEATKRLAEESGLKVTASGGISSIEDIRRVRELEPFGVDSVITGKALYEGTLDLRAALEAARWVSA